MQRVAPGAGVVFAGDAARLDRIGGDAVDDEALLDHMRGSRERRIGLGLVAGLVEIGLVVRAVVVELRRALLERLARRHHGRPRRVIDRDGFGRVAGEIERVGDHHRDRIADMHGAIDGDRRPRRQIHRAAVALLVRRHRRQRAERVGGIILAGQHGVDAGHLPRRAGVDATDIGMGVRRAHDRGMELIGELEIVEIAAAPTQQARVLAPQHRLSDGKFAHDLTAPYPPMTSPNLEPALLWARRGAKARPRAGGQRGDMRRLIFLSALFILGAGSAFADDYPSHPIRLIVPFAPGGAVDPIARLIANPLGERPRQADRDL